MRDEICSLMIVQVIILIRVVLLLLRRFLLLETNLCVSYDGSSLPNQLFTTQTLIRGNSLATLSEDSAVVAVPLTAIIAIAMWAIYSTTIAIPPPCATPSNALKLSLFTSTPISTSSPTPSAALFSPRRASRGTWGNTLWSGEEVWQTRRLLRSPIS